MSIPEIVVTGFNVLLESVMSDDRTESGIIMPDNKQDANKLSVGVVRAKGPGFIQTGALRHVRGGRDGYSH